MKYTEICNDKWLFIWVGLLLFAVIAQCMLFMSKAWKHGMEIGLKQSQLKGFKDRDHDQYHANTSGFTGVVFAHTTPGNPASVAASFGYRLCLL